jgi:two-component system response regulator RegA
MVSEQMKPSVLLVDDVQSFRETLSLEFEERGYRVFQAATAAEALTIVGTDDLMFIVLDLRLLGEDGHELIPQFLALRPNVRIVILTGYGSVASAVHAIRLGAANYLTKPVRMERLERALWSDDLDPEDVAAPEGRESIARHEREYLEYVLRQCDGNITRAAEWLGIHRQSLQRKLRKFPPSE